MTPSRRRLAISAAGRRGTLGAICRISLVAALLLAGGVAEARRSPARSYPQFTVAGENNLQEHGHYTSRSGQTVHAPAHSLTGAVPAGASAKCRDGSYSFSQSARGTCSRHGGVAQWLN